MMGRRLIAESLEAAIAIGALATSLAFAVAPGANPIHLIVEPWDFLWAILYAAGAIFTLRGLTLRDGANVEATGLVMLTGGLLVQLIVFATFLPPRPSTIATLVTLGAVAAGMALRFIRVIAESEPKRPTPR